jgi:hypothetical protein
MSSHVFSLILTIKHQVFPLTLLKWLALAMLSAVCFLRSGQWTLNILFSRPSGLIAVCNIFSTYFWLYSCFVSLLIFTEFWWYLLMFADSCFSAAKDIPWILVVVFVRHLWSPVGLHFHASVTSVFAWIRIHQLLNQTITYCSNLVLFPLIVSGKKSLFCTSQSLWWVVCSCSVSWMLSVDVSIVAFLTLHVSPPFW